MMSVASINFLWEGSLLPVGRSLFLLCTFNASGKKREGKSKAATLLNSVAAFLSHVKSIDVW